MSQPTLRQQCLALLMVACCFLAGSFCETLLTLRPDLSKPSPQASNRQAPSSPAPMDTAFRDRL